MESPAPPPPVTAPLLLLRRLWRSCFAVFESWDADDASRAPAHACLFELFNTHTVYCILYIVCMCLCGRRQSELAQFANSC